MGSQKRYSKELKIEVCERYRDGEGGFKSIAKEIGCHNKTLRRWYYKYIEHGPSVFDNSPNRKSYEKEFKLSIIKSYLDGNYSMNQLAIKYNIAVSVVERWIQMYNNGIEIKSYNPKGDIYTMKSKKTTYEERLEIVNWTISNNLNYKEAAESYKINYALVYKWTQSYIKDGEKSLQYKKRGPKPQDITNNKKLSEVEQLEQALNKETALRKRRELEIEILKKKEEYEKEIFYQK